MIGEKALTKPIWVQWATIVLASAVWQLQPLELYNSQEADEDDQRKFGPGGLEKFGEEEVWKTKILKK